MSNVESRAPAALPDDQRLGLVDRVARRIARLVGWRRWLLAAALGAMAAAALPPLHALPLLIPAFTGLVWLIDASRGLRGAFAAGWWFGFGHFVAGLYWIAFALLTDPARFGWMVPFAVFGLSGVLALYPALATLLIGCSRTTGMARVIVLAMAWTVTEWARGHLFTGFPWNLVGTAWTASDAMMQPAAVTGVYGLGLITVVAAAMPATLAGRGSVPALRRWAPTAAVSAGLVVLGAAGSVRLAGAGTDAVPGVVLRLVQPNVPQKEKWKPELREANLARHLRLSASPPADAVTHVVWPEAAVPFLLGSDEVARRVVATAVPAGGVLISGSLRAEGQGGTRRRMWNSVYAIAAAGDILATYDKFHLVPFGEYVPFRDILPVDKITPGTVDFSSGPGLRTMSIPGLPPMSPLICYEAIFPGRVANDDAAWLLNVTNDAWFGNSSGPYQHFASARLRAVEEGRPLVRVANTGISAVVDPYGRIQARLALGREGVIDAGLPAPLADPTLYARLGEWITVLMLGIAAMLAWTAWKIDS